MRYAQLQSLATVARSHFETIQRGEETVWTRKDSAPQWVQDMVYAAHNSGGMFPDDWRYQFIVQSLDAIVDHDSQDDARDSIEADIYTSNLTSWLGSRADRAGYVDDAVDELGQPENGIVGMIQLGQLAERWEVFDSIVSHLENLDIVDDVTDVLREFSGHSFHDDEIGSVDELGWYARFDGPISAETLARLLPDTTIDPDVLNDLATMSGAILNADSQGFYYSEVFTDPESLETAWSNILADYADSEPSDDDLITEDFRTFYVHNGPSADRIAFTVGDDEDWHLAFSAYCDQQGFYPNVWFQDDHGGLELVKQD